VRAGSSCSLRNQGEERHGRLLGGLALWMGERRVVVDCARAHMMLGTLFPCHLRLVRPSAVSLHAELAECRLI